MSKETREIFFEFDEIEKMFSKTKPLFDYCKTAVPDYIFCIAAAGTVHSYYNGIENIFKRINKATDDKEITGGNSHAKLLELMIQETKKRRAVITPELGSELEEFMKFRHFYRHAYSHNLIWDKIAPFFLRLEENWKSVKGQLSDFLFERIERKTANPISEKIEAEKTGISPTSVKKILETLPDEEKDDLRSYLQRKTSDFKNIFADEKIRAVTLEYLSDVSKKSRIQILDITGD